MEHVARIKKARESKVLTAEYVIFRSMSLVWFKLSCQNDCVIHFVEHMHPAQVNSTHAYAAACART